MRRSLTLSRSILSRPILFTFCLFLLWPGAKLAAHDRNESYSLWRLDAGGARVVYTIGLRLAEKITLALGGENFERDQREDRIFAGHILENLRLRANQKTCSPGGDARLSVLKGKGLVRLVWRVKCKTGAASLEIQNDLFLEKNVDHVHIARVKRPRIADEEILLQPGLAPEKILGGARRRWRLNFAAGRANDSLLLAIGRYFWLGLEHISGGLDHLAFLLGILLLSRNLREVLIIITGFTLGHSLTLGVGAAGLLSPNERIVEALIGFSVALVGVESVVRLSGRYRIPAFAAGGFALLTILCIPFSPARDHFFSFAMSCGGMGLFAFAYFNLVGRLEKAGEGPRLFWARRDIVYLRPLVAVLFGLIHGFGFGGGLSELGLPPGRFLSALLGFNLGVEAGQLLVVLVVFGVLRYPVVWFSEYFFKTPEIRVRGATLLLEIIASGLTGLGLYWFIERTFG